MRSVWSIGPFIDLVIGCIGNRRVKARAACVHVVGVRSMDPQPTVRSRPFRQHHRVAHRDAGSVEYIHDGHILEPSHAWRGGVVNVAGREPGSCVHSFNVMSEGFTEVFSFSFSFSFFSFF